MEVPALAEVLFLISGIIFVFTLILILKSGILWEKHPEKVEMKSRRKEKRRLRKRSEKTDIKGSVDDEDDSLRDKK